MPYPVAFRMGRKDTSMIARAMIINTQKIIILIQSQAVIVLSAIISTPITMPVRTKINV
jgi:hypothetical protein